MKTKYILGGYLAIMLALIAAALWDPRGFTALLSQPSWYLHAKFTHILCVTLFFANVVIGTIWETRSLLTGRLAIIRYTYQTVVWLDAIFTAPLILISLLSGLMLATILGGVWSQEWLASAFLLFILSGLVWIVADIPTQYRVNQLFARLSEDETELSPALRRVLWFRVGLNLFAIIPLLIVFFLMVHKPPVPLLRPITSSSGQTS